MAAVVPRASSEMYFVGNLHDSTGFKRKTPIDDDDSPAPWDNNNSSHTKGQTLSNRVGKWTVSIRLSCLPDISFLNDFSYKDRVSLGIVTHSMNAIKNIQAEL